VVSHEHIFGGPLPGQVEKWCINCFLSKREIEEGVSVNIYDDKRQQIGEVNFQMGRAVVSWKDGDTKQSATLPNHIFDGIKRMGGHAAPVEEAVEGAETLYIPGVGEQEVVPSELYTKLHKHMTRVDLMVDRFCADQDISVKEGEATADVLESILNDIAGQERQGFDVSRLRSENKSLGMHLEELKKRNQELSGAVESLRRQRDVRTKMLNAVLLDELEDHG
jgi:hypothetical protein